MTAKSNIAINAMLRRLWPDIPIRKKQAMKAPNSLTRNQLGPCGRLVGLKRALAAIVLTFNVAWPLVVMAVKVIVELGVNEQIGVSLKFVGVTAHAKFTVPV